MATHVIAAIVKAVKNSIFITSVLLIGGAVLAACSSSSSSRIELPGMKLDSRIPTSTSANVRWAELFKRTPYPYATPLPPTRKSAIDGIYIKIDPRTATPFPCRRCPDYAMEGGLWKVSFDNGIFRIIYAVNGWRSLGSFVISSERLILFNDPNCLFDVGQYIWGLEEGQLILKEISDICSNRLRARNLANQPWLSCQPPRIVDQITGRWTAPVGCDEP